MTKVEIAELAALLSPPEKNRSSEASVGVAREMKAGKFVYDIKSPTTGVLYHIEAEEELTPQTLSLALARDRFHKEGIYRPSYGVVKRVVDVVIPSGWRGE